MTKINEVVMRLLYIGEKAEKATFGWEQVNFRNQKVLEVIFEKVDYLPLDNSFLSNKILMGGTLKFLNQLDNLLLKQTYDYIFVCKSSLGIICKYIKKKYPNIKVVTFFHNIEVHYAKQYMQVCMIKGFLYYIRMMIYEKMSVKYSDILITLNSRDAKLLKDIYGFDASAILPTSLEDNFVKIDKSTDEFIDFLFVGAAFYANIEGVQWFINNVMPQINGNFYVVGKNMKSELFKNLSERIHILGFVEDLSDFYNRAKFIVSPIFHGGGMKTKTAEALMYGKLILGTNEAFEGYVINEKCMITCNNAEEFVSNIKRLQNSFSASYIDCSREHFIKYHSYQSSISILKKLFLTL